MQNKDILKLNKDNLKNFFDTKPIIQTEPTYNEKSNQYLNKLTFYLFTLLDVNNDRKLTIEEFSNKVNDNVIIDDKNSNKKITLQKLKEIVIVKKNELLIKEDLLNHTLIGHEDIEEQVPDDSNKFYNNLTTKLNELKKSWNK